MFADTFYAACRLQLDCDPTIILSDLSSYGGSDGVARGVPQADLAIDPGSDVDHMAYLRLNGNPATGLPVYSRLDRFVLPALTFEIVASAAAYDVAVAVDAGGVPLVAFGTSGGAFVFRRDGPSCWVAHTTDGGQPSLPPLVPGTSLGGVRGVDLAVAGTTVFLAIVTELIISPGFPGYSNTITLHRRDAMLVSSVGRASWSTNPQNTISLALIDPTAGSPPLAVYSPSIAVSPVDGTPFIACTVDVAGQAGSAVFQYDPITLRLIAANSVPGACCSWVHACLADSHASSSLLADGPLPCSLADRQSFNSPAPIPAVAPSLAFGAGGELYVAIVRTLGPSVYDTSNTTLSVYQRLADDLWVPVGDEFFLLSASVMPALARPALAVHPATGEPWVAFYRKQEAGVTNKLALWRYGTVAPVG